MLLHKSSQQVVHFFLSSPPPSNSRRTCFLSQGIGCQGPPTAGRSSCSRYLSLFLIPHHVQSNYDFKFGDAARGETKNIHTRRLGSGIISLSILKLQQNTTQVLHQYHPAGPYHFWRLPFVIVFKFNGCNRII